MCFAPQRRALFRHLNFQKWSGAGVFCTFWLQNVLRATTACTFSTSQLPKVVRPWCALCIFTSKCASRHNGVQFFISHLASWLRTRRFSEPTFRPSGATNHWKNTVFRDFPIFSRICIFFLLTLSLLLFFLLIFLFSLLLPCSAFHLSILSEVWLLNFLRLYVCVCKYITYMQSPTDKNLLVFAMLRLHGIVKGLEGRGITEATGHAKVRVKEDVPGVCLVPAIWKMLVGYCLKMEDSLPIHPVNQFWVVKNDDQLISHQIWSTLGYPSLRQTHGWILRKHDDDWRCRIRNASLQFYTDVKHRESILQVHKARRSC